MDRENLEIENSNIDRKECGRRKTFWYQEQKYLKNKEAEIEIDRWR
tara:strand:+ start:1314 stop:1451 length:138 start_codon:yes stop_codon:yes gene_type:complete